MEGVQIVRQAPADHFRVIGKDGPKDSGWLRGDYTTLDEAKRNAIVSGHVSFHIYDDKGKQHFLS